MTKELVVKRQEAQSRHRAGTVRTGPSIRPNEVSGMFIHRLETPMEDLYRTLGTNTSTTTRGPGHFF